MSPHIVWIITGTCGEYSDRSWWTVCWRMTEAEARAVVEVMNAEAATFKLWLDSDDGVTYGPKFGVGRAAMADPYFQTDFTGTKYTCEALADDARAFFDEMQTRQGER